MVKCRFEASNNARFKSNQSNNYQSLLHVRPNAATLAVFLEIGVLEKLRKFLKNTCNGEHVLV